MVTAILIIEMLGRPKEHAAEAIREYISRFDAIKHVTIHKKEFSEPKLVDESLEMYACFCEIELSCETFLQLVNVVFDFMPSSVEVVDPARLSFESNAATEILNSLVGRLHRYDDVVKMVQNNQTKISQEIKLARKLLIDNKIIDVKGNILKRGDEPSPKHLEDANN